MFRRENMDAFWTDFKFKLTDIGPSIVAGISLLPGGLTTGYMYAAFIIERNKSTFLRYGPFLLGIFIVAIMSSLMLFLKYYKKHIIISHFQVLVIACILNFVGAGFFFAKDYDVIGGFLTVGADALSMVAALSYIHIIASKENRSVLLSSCFISYILGQAMSVSVISASRTTELADEASTNSTDLPKESEEANHYLGFAWLFICCSILVSAMIIAVEVFYQMNYLDYETMQDEDLRTANVGEIIFDNREDVIKRVRDTRSFFYVTKNRQWLISFVLIFSDAIYNALFIYFIFWFTLNKTTSLTKDANFGVLLWVVLLGCAISTGLMWCFSVKRIFIGSLIGHLVIIILGIILYATTDTLVPFWFTCLLFGISYCNIKISILETSHFLLTEIYIFIFYTTNVISVSVINSVFISNSNNLYFYSNDTTTLIGQSLTLSTIVSLLAIVIGLTVPKTFKTSLLEIQYELIGIIFTEHRIEQLNIGYLNDGHIPTIQTVNA